MTDAKPRGRFVWFDLMTTRPGCCAGVLLTRDGLGDGSGRRRRYTMWTSDGARSVA